MDAKKELREIALKHIVTHDFAIAADIFTFGDGVNNAIYRALLEETDSASGVFEGTVEYQMLNQRTEAESTRSERRERRKRRAGHDLGQGLHGQRRTRSPI